MRGTGVCLEGRGNTAEAGGLGGSGCAIGFGEGQKGGSPRVLVKSDQPPTPTTSVQARAVTSPAFPLWSLVTPEAY